MLKFLLVLLIIFMLLRMMGKVIVVRFFKNIQQQQQQQNNPQRPEGHITIQGQEKTNSRGSDAGEYVDYEEIK
ncbi:MAG TPA: hypothetical protein VFW78_13145 [Bacteroidia bacterium]|nr:hypothetical protein [Bacteroidia bacterium]